MLLSWLTGVLDGTTEENWGEQMVLSELLVNGHVFVPLRGKPVSYQIEQIPLVHPLKNASFTSVQLRSALWQTQNLRICFS